MTIQGYINNLSLRSELLEALDWDEEELKNVLETCNEVLSEITDISQARDCLERLQTELIISRGEFVAKTAISYYLNNMMKQQNEGS
jgi:hypothetical protein